MSGHGSRQEKPVKGKYEAGFREERAGCLLIRFPIPVTRPGDETESDGDGRYQVAGNKKREALT